MIRVRIIFCLSVVLLLGVHSLSAQNIFGVVTSEDGLGLPGVHVLITQQHGTVTNTDGRFEFLNLNPGTYELTFSMVGFERQTHSISLDYGEQIEKNVILRAITYHSGEILVTAGRRAQVSGRVPVSLATISAAELERRNIVSLEQSLRYVPGVQISENQVNIRGASGFSYGVGSRVLLLIDGIPVMGPDQGDIKLEAIPMAQASRVEIVKGPGSAMYGSGALGGVINIITKDFSPKPQTTARVFYGVYDKARYEMWRRNWDGASQYRPYQGVMLSHSQQVSPKFGFWVHGLYSSNKNYLENSDRTQYQVYTKLGYRHSSVSEFSAYGGFRWAQNRQFLYWNGLNDPLRTGRIDFGDRQAVGGNFVQTEHYSFLPQYRYFFSANSYLSLRGRAYAIAVRPLDRFGNQRARDQHTIGFRYGSEAEFVWVPTQQTSVITGISVDDIYAESEFFIGQDSTMLRNQPEYAAFIQVDHDVNRQLTLSGGLRFDAYRIDTQDVASRISPKINAAYSLTEAWTIRAAFGLGFRVPGVAERFVNNQDFIPLESNLDLRPEESTGFEIGQSLVYRFASGAMLDTDLAFFWNEYRNMVEPKFVIGLASFQFVNLTEARVRGAESSLRFATAGGKQRLHVGYTYLDHLDKTENKPLVYRSTHQVLLGLDTELPFGFQFGLDYRFYSKPKRLDSDFSRFVVDAEAFVPVHVTDLRLSKKIDAWRNSEVLFTAAINNLFHYYYTERPAYLAEPRHASMSMQVRF